MGRLTLNILLSFAQFEREVIGERIRDKVAASRKRGMWMGGYVPLGYDVRDRKLIINEAEAATVRMIFKRFVAIGSATKLAKALVAESVRTKSGRPVDKGYIYRLLNSRSIWARPRIRTLPIPVSMRRSLIVACGTRCTAFCKPARGCVPPMPGRARRPC